MKIMHKNEKINHTWLNDIMVYMTKYIWSKVLHLDNAYGELK